MSESIESKVNPTETGAEEKKFTQAEVDAIISKRLSEVKRASENNLLDEREAELSRRELELKAREVLAEKNMPKELAKTLKYDTEDELMEAVTCVKDAMEKSVDISGFKPLGGDPLPKGVETDHEDSVKAAFGLK
ncbi:MAG: hypothetical protein U0M21_01975 [Emergencia sp.]|nr:hypothetical protein [Emergencia sp.]